MELTIRDIATAFDEQLPPLTANAAAVEADRCLFCYDAPCTHACPTHIDIPRFIGKIASRNVLGEAETIFAANLLGATSRRSVRSRGCAKGRACWGATTSPSPSGGCNVTLWTMADRKASFATVKSGPSGRWVAVIGSGPAGLSCAGDWPWPATR